MTSIEFEQCVQKKEWKIKVRQSFVRECIHTKYHQ